MNDAQKSWIYEQIGHIAGRSLMIGFHLGLIIMTFIFVESMFWSLVLNAMCILYHGLCVWSVVQDVEERMTTFIDTPR